MVALIVCTPNKNKKMTILKKSFIGVMLLSVLFNFGCKSKKLVEGPGNTAKYAIDFVDSETLMPVIEQAAAEDKMVFLDFYTTWCTPCKLMEEDVFTDPAIGEYFNENFLNMKIDAESQSGANIAGIFGVGVYPTLIFLDKKGVQVVRHEGVAYHTKLKKLAKEALQNSDPN